MIPLDALLGPLPGLVRDGRVRGRVGGCAGLTLRTYWRLRREADAAEVIYGVAIWARLAKFDAWLNSPYGDLLREGS